MSENKFHDGHLELLKEFNPQPFPPSHSRDEPNYLVSPDNMPYLRSRLGLLSCGLESFESSTHKFCNECSQEEKIDALKAGDYPDYEYRARFYEFPRDLYFAKSTIGFKDKNAAIKRTKSYLKDFKIGLERKVVEGFNEQGLVKWDDVIGYENKGILLEDTRRLYDFLGAMDRLVKNKQLEHSDIHYGFYLCSDHANDDVLDRLASDNIDKIVELFGKQYQVILLDHALETQFDKKKIFSLNGN